MALTCILVSVVVLMALPKGLYRPPGVSALGGLMRFVGHAALSGAPAALWAWADPTAPVEALIGMVVAGIAVSTLTLAMASMERASAPRVEPRAAPLPETPVEEALPPPPGISPWLMARVR